MSLVPVTKISSLMLATVAEQAGLSLTWSETPEDMFSHDKAQMILIFLLPNTMLKVDFKLSYEVSVFPGLIAPSELQISNENEEAL